MELIQICTFHDESCSLIPLPSYRERNEDLYVQVEYLFDKNERRNNHTIVLRYI